MPSETEWPICDYVHTISKDNPYSYCLYYQKHYYAFPDHKALMRFASNERITVRYVEEFGRLSESYR